MDTSKQVDWGHPENTEMLKSKVAAIIEENPSTMVRSIAESLNISQQCIIACLPKQMRTQVPVADFEYVWEAMTEWEKVTFIAETPGAVIELSTKLPKGKTAHGMYNLMNKAFALGGHILLANIKSIWLVSKPAFGLESHSVQFFSLSGAPCFAIYLGRAEKRAIIPSVREGYMLLWNKYSLQTSEALYA